VYHRPSRTVTNSYREPNNGVTDRHREPRNATDPYRHEEEAVTDRRTTPLQAREKGRRRQEKRILLISINNYVVFHILIPQGLR
jgi:hypothetical protein